MEFIEILLIFIGIITGCILWNTFRRLQGPQGSQGPEGPVGPAGPAGKTGKTIIKKIYKKS